MRVKITLTEEARKSAIEMRKLRGIPTDADFEGPDFSKVESTYSDVNFFVVKLMDQTEYMYPLGSIARIAKYPEKVFLGPTEE